MNIKTKILIVDDHFVVRDGIRGLLEKTPDLRITGEAADAPAALAILGTDQPFDIVLLDISLPGMSGLDAIPRIHAIRPNLPILMFSGLGAEEYGAHSLRLGATGYLNKECDPEEMRNAIRRVVGGEVFVGSTLERRLRDRRTGKLNLRHPHEALTTKEFDILQRIARGQRLIDIAEELHLSPKTISTHRLNILSKMNLDTDADLVRYILRLEGLPGATIS